MKKKRFVIKRNWGHHWWVKDMSFPDDGLLVAAFWGKGSHVFARDHADRLNALSKERRC